MKNIQQQGWKRGDSAASLLTREWLVTNGLGGYCSGTLGGVATRRFHGLLIAATGSQGRLMMFNHLEEWIKVGDARAGLGGREIPGSEPLLPGADVLVEFFLDLGMPVWRYATDQFEIIKRITMPYWQNTTILQYELVRASAPVTLELRPSFHFRQHEALLAGLLPTSCRMVDQKSRWEVTAGEGYPALRLRFHGAEATLVRDEKTMGAGASAVHNFPEFLYRIEQDRGYDSAGTVWTPGSFGVDLTVGVPFTVIGSIEPWEIMEAITPSDVLARERERLTRLLHRAGTENSSVLVSQLVMAADQFVITPTRARDLARAHATGDEPRTVIAGYHWFTDWGRDTMISLEGLTLVTGREREGGRILQTFASYVRDGLIPNHFPEGQDEGVYHTADATLWFFHAVDRYVEKTGDRATLRRLLPSMIDMVEHHIQGTRFGIGVDPADGLLRQGAEGYQLTWMDAKVDGWVVTPRRGKAVEINALFYNALCVLGRWLAEEGDASNSGVMATHAKRVRQSFNERFWYAEGGYLYDVIDGENGAIDSALRPNQILSLSLPNEVLDPSRWAGVVDTVQRELLTPVGLRSLARTHPDYKANYHGDLRTRDAAYHQGTVWGWLIGPFFDAWLKVHPGNLAGARQILSGIGPHLGEGCVGSISEIFDAEEPFMPRGCVAQAWSVAEALRCLMKLEELEASTGR